MKYSKDGPFADPLVRCDSCARIITQASMKKSGMCEHCGNRRIRNVQSLTEEEMDFWKQKDIDPDFFALFEAVESG